MDTEILEVIEILEGLVVDLPLKSKIDLLNIISELKKPLTTQRFMEVQDSLEYFSSNSTIDSFTRTEIINIISYLDTLFQ